jgi:hypothetical protein
MDHDFTIQQSILYTRLKCRDDRRYTQVENTDDQL